RTGSVAGAKSVPEACSVTTRPLNQVSKSSGTRSVKRPVASVVVVASTSSRRPRSAGPNGRRASATTFAPETGAPAGPRTVPVIALEGFTGSAWAGAGESTRRVSSGPATGRTGSGFAISAAEMPPTRIATAATATAKPLAF